MKKACREMSGRVQPAPELALDAGGSWRSTRVGKWRFQARKWRPL